jgi:hypothetical protein
MNLSKKNWFGCFIFVIIFLIIFIKLCLNLKKFDETTQLMFSAEDNLFDIIFLLKYRILLLWFSHLLIFKI